MQAEGLETLSRQTLEALQMERLNELLRRERARGGFYAKLPERLSSLGELQTLPFTSAEELNLHGGGMLLVSQSELQRVITDETSGTTGRPKRVFYTAEDCQNTIGFFAAGLSELVFPGDTVMITMPFSGPYGLGELIAEAIRRLGARPLKTGIGKSFGELREILVAEKPVSYVGMPVPLLSMLRFCGRGSLRCALVSGDACPERVIAAAEGLLQTRLFPHYGLREMALGGAVTCPAHRGMHLRENHVIAEIIAEDGRVLPEGETGELCITTIGMKAQPLIRYRTGDFTRILSEPCPCGGVTKRIDGVERRGAAAISRLDDALFSIPQLIDYRAERRSGTLYVNALTVRGDTPDAIFVAAEALYPDSPIHVSARACGADDAPLYPGKRYIL